MNKVVCTIGVALAAVSSAFGAAEGDAVAVAEPEKPAVGEELEPEEEAWLTFGVDNDLLSAYVWRNAVVSDELVWQPCVWLEASVRDWFSVGGFVWQNWDLTANPAKSGRPRAMNETDFNVYLARTLWASEDEAYSFGLEIGNDFFTYRQIEDCPNSYELYVKATFDNPFVGVYGQYSQAYEPVAAPYFELGLTKEVTFDRFTFGAEWNVSMGSGKYFTNYLYGTLPGEYDAEAEECDERGMSDGIGGTTIKGTCAYQVCDHFSVGLVIAYTALLSGEACDAMDFAEQGNMYKRLVWGGLQAKLDF